MWSLTHFRWVSLHSSVGSIVQQRLECRPKRAVCVFYNYLIAAARGHLQPCAHVPRWAPPPQVGCHVVWTQFFRMRSPRISPMHAAVAETGWNCKSVSGNKIPIFFGVALPACPCFPGMYIDVSANISASAAKWFCHGCLLEWHGFIIPHSS